MELLVQRKDGNAQSTIKFYLRNNTEYSISGEFRITGFSEGPDKVSIFTEAGKVEYLHSAFLHNMERSPVIEYEISTYSTIGRENNTSGHVKVKPKDFVNKSRKIEGIGESCISYPLLNNKGKEKTGKNQIEFKFKTISEPSIHKLDIFNTEEFINFNPVIDLHLHNLVEDVSKVKPEMAMMIQLSAFHRHLDKAIRLGIDRIFIIHGVGEGKLRNAVMKSAKSNPIVKEVKNEYHPKFGFGATEIIF